MNCNGILYLDMSRRSWSPATTGPPGPSAANYVAVDGPPGPNMAAMDGPLCRKWSPCSTEPENSGCMQLQIHLYILTDEFEAVTIKIFRNNAMHVCCDSESSLAAKTTFFFLLIRDLWSGPQLAESVAPQCGVVIEVAILQCNYSYTVKK